jgi:hypothetical protein
LKHRSYAGLNKYPDNDLDFENHQKMDPEFKKVDDKYVLKLNYIEKPTI